MEPFFLFIQDEVAKPVIGHKYARFMPFIMALFFFILGLNLIGQIPFFGNPNVTGNIAVTAVLAVITFIITNVNGNKHYWQHVFWMPGVPIPVRVILSVIEFFGLFIKPFTLMIRLFANISAGHIAILSFVGLIFIFGDSGQSVGGGIGGIFAASFLALFMSCIELIVAFIQAFIFAILSASYIGAAIEDDHH
jgi:F-type H+-transporting ATPase subunit a